MINKMGSFLLGFIFVYLVSMMIVLGNGSSFLGRYLGEVYTPVANSIGLNTTWNFFSPDPAHTMYLKYRILFQDEYGNETQDAVEKYFPEDSTENNFWPHRRRLSYVMRFLAMNSARIEKFLVPWLCKKYPQATRVQTEMIFFRIPALDVVSTLSSENYEELLKQEEMNQESYACVR